MKTNNKKIFISNKRTIELPSDFELILYENIDSINNNSIEEIFIGDLFDCFLDDQIKEIIKTIFTKLIKDGKLHIQSTDIEQLALYLVNKIIPIENKNILYTNNRINIQTMHSLLGLIQQSIDNSSFSILNKKYVNGYHYYIVINKIND